MANHPATQAIYTKMATDATLTDMLATYDPPGVGGVVPAIFSSTIVPGGAEFPFVHMPGAIADEPNDTKNDRGREVQWPIYVYSKTEGSVAEADNIAQRLQDLFHRQSLTIDGNVCYITEMRGPVAVPTSNDVTGRMVTLRARYKTAVL